MDDADLVELLTRALEALAAGDAEALEALILQLEDVLRYRQGRARSAEVRRRDDRPRW